MLADRFFKLAVIFILVGMAMGLWMGATQDHSLFPAHAHLNLLGFVMNMIFGFYYKLNPLAADGKLPQAHFWLFNIAVPVQFFGVVQVLSGNLQYEPMLIVANLAAIAATAIFALIVFRTAKV